MESKYQKYVSIYTRRFLFLWLLLWGIGGLLGRQAQAAEIIDQQYPYASGSGSTEIVIGQTWTPAAGNLSSLDFAAGAVAGSGSATGSIAVCLGTPDYVNTTINIDCQGENQVLLYKTGFSVSWPGSYSYTIKNITLTGSYPLTVGAKYFFVIDNENSIPIVYNSTCCYSGGSAFTTAGNTSVDLFFRTYYNDSEIGTPILNIVSPVNNAVVTDNTVNFSGTSTHAASLEIYYGPANASPANFVYGVSSEPYNVADWDFSTQLPNGYYWITYILKNTNSTYTATTSLTVTNPNNNSMTPISSSTMSSTTAWEVLKNSTIECGSSAPAFINDPYTFWASNTPAGISSNGSTSTSTPFFYEFIAGGIYKLTKPPIDMANNISCYLSTKNAAEKGQAVAVILKYFGTITKGINDLVGFPITTITIIWAIGLALWFARKLLPIFK